MRTICRGFCYGGEGSDAEKYFMWMDVIRIMRLLRSDAEAYCIRMGIMFKSNNIHITYMSTSKAKTRKRCPRGYRRNSSTGECVPQTVSSLKGPRVAIIVPFRDTTITKERTKQLKEFLKYMSEYMTTQVGVPYKIFIIEQAHDGEKFNRGKLLNIGFDIAQKAGFESFIFHDVDLLPSVELAEFYSTVPPRGATYHIAAVWGRYNKNPAYFGGITVFRKQDFRTMNGYPNNFWGWGGEDDELYTRAREAHVRIIKPRKGTIKDLENLTVANKMAVLKKTGEKFMLKYEMLNTHKTTWRKNGLSNLDYNVVSESRCQVGVGARTRCVRIRVDVVANGGDVIHT